MATVRFECGYWAPYRGNEKNPSSTGYFEVDAPDDDQSVNIHKVYDLFEARRCEYNVFYALLVPFSTFTGKDLVINTLCPLTSCFQGELNTLTQITALALRILIDLVTLPVRLFTLAPRIYYQSHLPDPLTSTTPYTLTHNDFSITIHWDMWRSSDHDSTVFHPHRGNLQITSYRADLTTNSKPRVYFLGP